MRNIRRYLTLLAVPWAAILLLAPPAAAADPFRVRAVHIDNRIQVLPLPELKRIVESVSSRGVNTIIMEWEGSFPFDQHRVISNQFAYTKAEIAEFVEFCAERGVDVVPLQQCLGHLEYVLQFERYAALREDAMDISQACPSQQEAFLELYGALLDELCAAHPSKYVHIGADETALLGHCPKCAARAEAEGRSALFIEHIRAVAQQVLERGKIPVLWADIVMKHPEAIDRLPPECVLVNWNYGWDVNHFGDHDRLLDSGHELWGALAMRSHPDNYFGAVWKTHFRNYEDFLPFMRDNGYQGVVLTSWSTSGVYSIVREPKRHVVDMAPLRRVYPMRGFQLLLDAYCDAIGRESFDAQAYVAGYAQQRFGLNADEADELWRHLTAISDVPVGDQSTRAALQSAREKACKLRDFLARSNNRTDAADVEHYRLMTAIRVFFLDVQLARLDAEAATGDAPASAALGERLTKLLRGADRLDAWFAELNAENLYPAAIAQENEARRLELQRLYERITSVR
ncbi:MAG: glycoside hydrolase family 20 [Planctomycetaceae bacterium]|nr:glycoside hydrolase family 20 [Planctomycetaceae bacterium]